jgi:hypothetical protein
MDSIRGELRVGLFGVVRPEDHRRPLALGYRPEAAVLASGSHRRDPDLVAVEDEVDVNRVTLRGEPEAFGEDEAGIEHDGTG